MQNIPSAYATAYSIASSELNNYLVYQADFAHGNISIGDYYMRMHDQKNAEKFYLRAISKDSLANLSRINLSMVYNSQGRNQEALNVLEAARRVDNKNPLIFYDLALLHNEMNNKTVALSNFEKAYQLNMQDPRFFYNYALLLQQMGNTGKAIKVKCGKGIKV